MMRGKVIFRKQYAAGGEPHWRSSPALAGTLILLASITMLFAALAGAMLVRSGLSDDWRDFPWPPLVWFNTALLVASSIVLDRASRSREHASQWWRVGTMLGLFFLAGQYFVWRGLAAQGLLTAIHPSAAFFYLFTLMHAIHVLGGVAALSWVAVKGPVFPPPHRAEAASLYWHFLTLLWLALVLLFVLVRRV